MNYKIDYDEKAGFIKIGALCFAPGFRSATYNKIHLFDFTRSQAQVINVVFDYYENGFPSVFQQEVIRHLNDVRFEDESREILNDIRIRDYFKFHPAWGTLIKTTKGRDSRIYLDFSWSP